MHHESKQLFLNQFFALISNLLSVFFQHVIVLEIFGILIFDHSVLYPYITSFILFIYINIDKHSIFQAPLMFLYK